MNSDGKKISFGFSKVTKQLNINKTLDVKSKTEFIACIEEQAIKIKDYVEPENKPLLIPPKENNRTFLDRIKSSNIHSLQTKCTLEDIRPDSELTLDELATRQLLQDARKMNNESTTTKINVLPISGSNDNGILQGAPESTAVDYENVPIRDYGLAMLRGMGWCENTDLKENRAKVISAPEVRPKGMGLGADKILKKENSVKQVDKDGHELALVRDAYAKIIAGKEKGNYCRVQGFDDESGRIIVKTFISGSTLSLNEFMLIPVTSEEYMKSARVINNKRYEEYKNKEALKQNSTQRMDESEKTEARNFKPNHLERKVSEISKNYETQKRNVNRSKSHSRSPEYRIKDFHGQKEKSENVEKRDVRDRPRGSRKSVSPYSSRHIDSRQRSPQSTHTQSLYEKKKYKSYRYETNSRKKSPSFSSSRHKKTRTSSTESSTDSENSDKYKTKRHSKSRNDEKIHIKKKDKNRTNRTDSGSIERNSSKTRRNKHKSKRDSHTSNSSDSDMTDKVHKTRRESLKSESSDSEYRKNRKNSGTVKKHRKNRSRDKNRSSTSESDTGDHKRKHKKKHKKKKSAN